MKSFTAFFLAIDAAFGATGVLPLSETQNPLRLSLDDGRHVSNTILDNIIDSSPLLSFHRDIVNIESISGNEADVGDYIIRFLESKNFTVVKQPISTEGQERFNIYAYLGNNSSPDILVTSHIDTVPPYVPYQLSHPDIADTDGQIDRRAVRIHGRGTVDAKGSVAAQIFAVLETLQHTANASLALLFVVGEENSGVGMTTFSNSEYNAPSPKSFQTVIFGEPTELNLVSGHKGGFGLILTATGKAAHSGYPWLGRNAISLLLPVANLIENLGNVPVEEGGLPGSSKYGNTTVNLGLIQGGIAGNVVPASAHASFLVRLASGTPEKAKRTISNAVRKFTGGNPDIQVAFTSSGTSPVDLDVDVEGFNVTTVNYGTDVPHLAIHERAGRKVKRYLYGPGSILVAHSDIEAVTVGELEDAVKGYRRLIEHALSKDNTR
ncbi:putative carboxypeptidase [Talaromyces pinophilus]|nr:putative carboxypeptidase [Talaromyces pinophilus]